jgi:AcrR family transcriptional regulator
MTKSDRRVERTRELLRQALIDLVRERHYDAIRIQDIVDRANVGRTTFYLHYRNKDELLMSCHEAIMSRFQFGPHAPRSRDMLLAPQAPAEMIAAYRHLASVRPAMTRLLRSRDSLLLITRLRNWIAAEMENSLSSAFPGADFTVPLDLLSSCLAGAQIALLQWWLTYPQPHTPEQVAQMTQRLQRAAIIEALGSGAAEETHGAR